MKGFVQDPNATLDYTVDWNLWLDGDTISTSVWVVESPLVNEADSNTITTTNIFISGGVHGENYVLTNSISTVSGRSDDRSIELRVRNR